MKIMTNENGIYPVFTAGERRVLEACKNKLWDMFWAGEAYNSQTGSMIDFSKDFLAPMNAIDDLLTAENEQKWED